MSSLEELTELFKKFPGIGPRQAKRFVYFLLTRDARFREELSTQIKTLKSNIELCTVCFRFFAARSNSAQTLCSVCNSQERDVGKLMLVEKDVDLENIEKSGAYFGRYFVLGGTIPILEKEPDRRIRSTELKTLLEQHGKAKHLTEVILALSSNPEGDNTARFLNELLAPFAEKYEFNISTLGRGLSTGSELEYSDADTIKNALENRH